MPPRMRPQEVNKQYQIPKPKSIKEVPSYVLKLIKTFFVRLFYIYKLVWEARPSLLFVMTFMSIFNGVSPVFGAYIGAEVLNTLALAFTGELSSFDPIISLLIVNFIYLFLINIINRVYNMVTRISGEVVSNHIKMKIVNNGRSREQLENVTLADALNHPNWSMGQKITIDSATMMNKGLELIEAAWLFDMPPEKIDIVVHRESIIHSLVEYDDNAVLAQLGTPDMRVPIQYALTYPDRLPCPAKQLRLEDWKNLTFYAPDDEAFPAMNLAHKALTMGGLHPAALNAANEVAVGAFIAGEIGFTDITRLAAQALELELPTPTSVEDVFAADALVRKQTREAIDRMK